MAIIPGNLYPGQTVPADSNYPQGAAKDVTAPGTGDGTPVKAAWVNDMWGFMQALLASGAVTPSGNPDTAISSQYLQALRNIFNGRVINIRFITAAETFTPNALTKAVLVAGVGGGGGGGGCAANPASQASGGQGGGAGAFAVGYYTSGFSGASVVVGSAGPAGATGANDGGAGGASTFGSLLSVSGGAGGKSGASQVLVAIGQTSTPNTATITGANLYSRAGDDGDSAILAKTTSPASQSGKGGNSPFGKGGSAVSTQGNGAPATGRGAGGSGGISYASSAAQAGGAGTGGAFLVVELG